MDIYHMFWGRNMKKLILILSVLCGQALFAEVLQTITITPANIELKEGESLPLHATGHYDTGAEKDITAKVEWSVADTQSVTIDANATLQALKEGMTTITAKLGSVESSTQVAVYWEVDGHRLPPEPDPAVNNATLLGIDVNNNGVRDDVERWIYETYDHPIERSIFMQSAYAYQKVIVDPSKAHETTVYIDDAYSCRKYWLIQNQDLKEKYNYQYPTKEVKKIQFNTIERHVAYERFNGEFNGEVLSAPEANKSKCLFSSLPN